VPLADIVSVRQRTGFSSVLRENGIRLVSVTGDISEDDPARAEAIMTALESEILPKIASERQIEWRMSGLSEQEDDFLNDARTGLVLCLTGIYLVLAWVFASWTRPLVVMAIIPFGLVGTIYGHAAWNVPLSMFTVVGLIGMTGIIINDSIVLVTTIDSYSQDRGLVPSIIEATADRLRPVLLTTLTTVLGLTPLMDEQSQQAQFLKPTVITLVYGLGFGMILVLLVVPALVAVQNDVARPLAAVRRALRQRRGPWLAVAISALLLGGWLAATLGSVLVQGALPEALLSRLPQLSGLPTMQGAFALFLGGAILITIVVYLGAALAYARSRRA
jgi:multidrug efflux pump subunit AcrB